ncbi:MAG TPA: acyclic terpene utilization AtuA family protein, partial [Polyangiales bacterium]|nr:acyclic terpene utilization AtuA family protein [Polyangiales bacterium]
MNNPIEQRVLKGMTLRIGGGSGFWGDSADGAAQLVKSGAIDVLVLDYLSEITMSLLARARQKRPELGYTPDFVSAVMEPLAKEIAQRGIKVIANAGGVNPHGCREALERALAKQGVTLKVAVVTGDDVRDKLTPALRDMETGHALPTEVASA